MKIKKAKKLMISLTLVLVLALTVLTGCQNGIKNPLETNLADTTGIRLEQAKQIALANARLAAAQVNFTGTALKTVEGNEIYALQFETDSYSYDYDIAADDGSIIDTAKKARDGDFISADRARQLALDDAGLTLDEVSFSKTKLDRDDEKVIYELEFTSQDNSYDYGIDASSGHILEVEKKPRQAAGEDPQPQSTEMIGEAQARQIALADAGLPKEAVTIKKTIQKKDDGREIYEVEFYTASHEYDYDIDAYTGMILEMEREARKPTETKNTTIKATTTKGTTKSTTTKSTTTKSTTTKGTTAASQETQKPTGYIGETKAKEIALKDAGFSAGQVSSLTIELKTKENPVYYEVEFRTSTYEYEYEIEAATGTILEMEKERLKKDSGASGTNYIAESRAKEIALKDAGLAGNVRFTEVELEIDGKKAKYEVEFISGNYEYEYDIDARTGDILEMEKELLRRR